ncbi:Quinolinate synthase A [Porphyromonas macacae]|uniref:Quinolinate synthase n=1 Tax=Porphyromonas macacae TaxID=28115 RepID=A0A379E8K8_9PORP|nr:quinolinate synthase NadA [Porphyromonas macacae]SUB88644.1 Quinolinate synthase A [Porphyromonas macacae]
MKKEEIIAEIARLKKEKNVLILAHYYARPEVQDIADFIGDSLQLSRQAAETQADIILFCGVHFMAETAAVLSPYKKVLAPTKYAGCSLAEGADAEGLRRWHEKNPTGLVVSYVNTTAAVKAETDYCVTSSNALEIVKSLPAGVPVLFGPDRNLGAYIAKETGRKMELWDACCFVHERIDTESIEAALYAYPEADVLIHPESKGANDVSVMNHPRCFMYSTAGILAHASRSSKQQFVIATEPETLHLLKKQNPGKEFIAIQPENRCHYMKQAGLWEVLEALREEKYRVTVPDEIRERALISLERMLRFG